VSGFSPIFGIGQFNGIIQTCPVAIVTKIWVYEHKIGDNSTCNTQPIYMLAFIGRGGSSPKILKGRGHCPVAALAIDKAGPRPYHFRSGPTSGPTTWPGSQKTKISVVHHLAVLKVHPECLKCRKTLWRSGLTVLPLRASLLACLNPFTKICHLVN